MNIEEVALEMFDAGIVKFGEFTLKSGLKSPYYLDHSVIGCHPRLLEKISKIYSEKIKAANVKKMCAVPYKAIIIGAVVAVQTDIPLLFTRKEVKDHGVKQPVDGTYHKGEEVAIVEDLISTGISTIEVARKLREAGLVVKHVFINVDREQGGIENLAKEGITTHYNMTFSQMLDVYVKHGRITKEKYDETKKYLEENKKFY